VVELTPRAVAGDRPPEQQTLAAGEVLFRQGDQGDLVYVVDAGSVDIVRECVDRPDELLQTVEPRGYFGELAPMFGLRRSASVRAGARGATVTGYTLRDFREQQSSA
jgi:putative ABC transport system ATP-binding protein